MLSDQIDSDLKVAMKERNLVGVDALRMLKSAIKNKSIEKRTDSLPDEAVLELVQKLIKQRKDSIEQFKKGNRQDLVDKETKEIALLERYLPSQLSDAELQNLVRETLDVTHAKTKSEIGRIMKEIMPKIKGRADSKRVNEIALKLLG
ncbi:MAG: hypothetical protein A3G87_02570 [Omnitrophica bacterium RIFCSPLOWO2_12_FULL_50_11]|nr:MAG: hypothetical protein A3G87_02570 [Omnitrophica bacterium RIFCSPLOWO2_12_FULL_50_11]